MILIFVPVDHLLSAYSCTLDIKIGLRGKRGVEVDLGHHLWEEIESQNRGNGQT